MRRYPSEYPLPAITVAERVIPIEIPLALRNDGHGRWSLTRGFLVRPSVVETIRARFAPDISNDELLRFIDLVFSRVLPQLHFELTSDGYLLALGEDPDDSDRPHVIIGEQPPGTHGYTSPARQASLKAALASVRALIDWRLACYGETPDSDHPWPVGEHGGADLIYGELYRMIRDIGQFSYVRVRDVIDFIHLAIPELITIWSGLGLEIVPVYHIGTGDQEPFISLRLVPVRQPSAPA
ncbi:hypothetical protein JNJ66_02335 [Candidatus Saccharibacteria bacterium]|nr:hypothetical protein [Candidatus Saccharibacteria bacterium]